MSPANTRAVVLAGIGSAGLVLLGFRAALEGAGPYQTLPGLETALAAGLGLGKFLVLTVVGLAACRVGSIGHAVRRRAAFVGLVIVAAGATLAAPLLASSALASLCVRPSLCPDIGNPLLWAYLRGFTALPWAPMLVGPLVASAMYVRTRRTVGHLGDS
ncbi:hypothetical protein [Rubrivivax sp. JA1026]|uniref:hypothetical protein n=1 Tax=Rubrivivax sp. JA1026 TaxID=2710888 RepID=UPI0013E90725|nr:hypothetical protein [Rubrivivax sp. JA1026]